MGKIISLEVYRKNKQIEHMDKQLLPTLSKMELVSTFFFSGLSSIICFGSILLLLYVLYKVLIRL
jgi:hypothetical protein